MRSARDGIQTGTRRAGPDLAAAVVLGLVSYRATRLLVQDQVLARPRHQVIRRLMAQGRRGQAVVALISCEQCLGWWVTGALTLAWSARSPRGGLGRSLWLWPAAAGVQSVLSSAALLGDPLNRVADHLERLAHERAMASGWPIGQGQSNRWP